VLWFYAQAFLAGVFLLNASLAGIILVQDIRFAGEGASRR
jgi:hypothetical protein